MKNNFFQGQRLAGLILLVSLLFLSMFFYFSMTGNIVEDLTIEIKSPGSITHNCSEIELNVVSNHEISRWWYVLNGGDEVDFDPNITFSGEEGNNELVVYGNSSETNYSGTIGQDSVDFVIDTTAPSFDNLEDQSIYENQSLEYDIDATDDSSSVESFSINDTGIFEIDSEGLLINSSSLEVGNYSLNVSVNDSVGNLVSEVLNIEVRECSFSEELPSICIHYPVSGNYTSNVSELNYSVNNFNSSKCWYSLDEGITNSSSVENENNFSGLTSNEGNNLWKVYCNNILEEQIFEEVSFFKDTLVPIIEVDSPNNNEAYTNSSISIDVETNEKSDCEYSFGDGFFDLESNTEGTIHEISESFSEGDYDLEITCEDVLGNSNSTEISFSVNISDSNEEDSDETETNLGRNNEEIMPLQENDLNNQNENNLVDKKDSLRYQNNKLVITNNWNRDLQNVELKFDTPDSDLKPVSVEKPNWEWFSRLIGGVNLIGNAPLVWNIDSLNFDSINQGKKMNIPLNWDVPAFFSKDKKVKINLFEKNEKLVDYEIVINNKGNFSASVSGNDSKNVYVYYNNVENVSKKIKVQFEILENESILYLDYLGPYKVNKSSELLIANKYELSKKFLNKDNLVARFTLLEGWKSVDSEEINFSQNI